MCNLILGGQKIVDGRLNKQACVYLLTKAGIINVFILSIEYEKSM